MYLYEMMSENGEPAYHIPQGTQVQEKWNSEGRYYVLTADRVGQWERCEVAVSSTEVTEDEVSEITKTNPVKPD